jgi:hypothetical protein
MAEARLVTNERHRRHFVCARDLIYGNTAYIGKLCDFLRESQKLI